MDLFSYVLCIVTGSIASDLAIFKNMHIFQLNSYKASTHCTWIKRNISKVWSQIFTLILTIPIFLISHKVIPFILSGVFVILCFFNKPIKNAKKPLVLTKRVKRMFATIFIIILGLFLISYFTMPPYKYLIILLVYSLSPIWVIISNIINSPIEASIRQYFINDAKKIIKSCPNLIVIGITGSYGKTSVKYYLTTLLKAKYNVLMTPESFNTPMGVVKTIREQLRATHDVFVCEMGAKRKGEIKELCDIVLPTHGIITSIGEQHLETFKTIETIIKTKFELADAVKENGIIFLNGDNKAIRENIPNQKCQTYGCSENNNFYAYDIRVTSSGTTFSLNCNGEKLEDLHTKLIGEHNVTNLVGAIELSFYLGVSKDDIRSYLNKISSPPHRLQLLNNNGMTIIDDAYNSNPSGCEAALKILSLFDGFKILITPGMVELGSKQNECNYEFGTKAAKVCDYIILVGEKQTKPIFDGIISAGYDNSKIFIADVFKEAISKAYSLETSTHKIILLENDLPDNY